MQAIIVGGGISGLSLALSLHQIGVAARVHESVRQPRAVGLGINLQPNAVRELTALGLGERLAARGIRTAELAFYNRHGQLVWSEPRGRCAGYRWPQISISRADLQAVLLEAVNERLGPEAVLGGHHFASYAERGERIVARFVDPDSRTPVGEAEGDFLVGADGIHSAVRRLFYPGEAPRFDGFLHYRGVTEGDPFLTGATVAIIGHRTRRVIVYPVATRPNGKAVINWLAYTRIPRGAPPLEAWDSDADKADFVDLFRDWRYPWLDVHDLLRRTDKVYQLPNVDRDPIPRWSFGRATLIGDAAHPMQPIGAQAGSQAVVDGRVLAAALMENADSVAALTDYQDRRIAAMNAMIVRNRNFGAETVLQLAEERAPNGFSDIAEVLGREELEETAASFKEAAGFDVATVNGCESLVPRFRSS